MDVPPPLRPGVGKPATLVQTPGVTRLVFLIVLASLIGCGPSEPASSDSPSKTTIGADSAASTAPEEKPAAETPAVEPPAVESAAEPWVLPREEGAMVDTFTFLGWSADNQRYAYQLYVAAQGASCSARYEVFVVDAATDSLAEAGKLEFKHESPEGGPDGCVPKKLEPDLEEGRARLLKTHGIVVGNHVDPKRVTRNEEGLFVAPWDGGALTFTLIVRHATDDRYGEDAAKGAGYVLTLHGGKEPVIIESGERRRSYVVNYSVLDAPFFVSPDGSHAALIIRRAHSAFEGTRTSYMSNGIALGVQ